MTPGPQPGGERPAVAPQVARFLGLARSSEEQLVRGLLVVAERHERDYGIHHGATTVAIWSREHLDWLTPLDERYGSTPSEAPEKIRAALLGGTRVGLIGLVEDLQDLVLLAEQVSTAWTLLYQGGKELHDDDVMRVSSEAREHTRRQLAWLRTMIEHTAPETLAVAADPAGELAGSLPRRPDAVASIPDPVWAPLVAGVLVAAVGIVGLAVGRPWLLPSLGPTAALAAENPAHPSSRLWNAIVGHVGGLIAGFVAVAALGVASDPVVLVAHEVTAGRVAASVVAIVLTIVAAILLRASHPPAAATTLLVALGSIATLTDALNLAAGVVIIGVLAELARRVRLERTAPSERMAPPLGEVRQALRFGRR